MDKIIFYPSAGIALILIAIYWFRCHRIGKEFSQSVMVNIVLQSAMLVCGCLLVFGTFIEEARALLSEIDLYILISGLVVLSVSVKSMHKDIFLSTKKAVSKSMSSNKSK